MSSLIHNSNGISKVNEEIDKILQRNGVSSQDTIEINSNIRKLLSQSLDFKNEVTYISAKTEQGETIYGSPVIGSWGKFISNGIDNDCNKSPIVKNAIKSRA